MIRVGNKTHRLKKYSLYKDRDQGRKQDARIKNNLPLKTGVRIGNKTTSKDIDQGREQDAYIKKNVPYISTGMRIENRMPRSKTIFLI